MSSRDIGAENEYLRKALALRRKFQQFIDADDPAAEAEFTIDGAAYYKVTPAQREILMGMAPEDVQEINRR